MQASVYCAHCGALNQPQVSTCFACDHSLDEPAPAAADARRLVRSRYRVVRQLGVGGFGAVYQAEDTALGNRLVALKEMRPRELKPEEAREATQAFLREALLLASLSHPSLPRIYERFEEEGRWYLVMDFIEGETLEVYLDKQGGHLPVKEALQIALQLTDVLGDLHSRQPPIIFRDLKPSNIMRSPEGLVVLVDFGIARFFKPGQTKDTTAFGSPGYAAPEQYGKAQTTPRSDVFSLGAVLHQMLTGSDPSEKPFRFGPLTMPRPVGLSLLIERMVRMEESQRPPSMESIRRELTSMLDGQTPWRDDELSLTGERDAPGRGAASAPPATDPMTQPAGSSAPPVRPVQWGVFPPLATKKRRVGWWFSAAVVVVAIWLIVNVLIPHGTTTAPVSTSKPISRSDTPSATHTAPAWLPAPPDGGKIPTYSVAWSPDGKFVASGGYDGTVVLWNVTTNEQLTLDTGFVSNVSTLAWSPDGRYLAAAGDEWTVQIWDAKGMPYRSYSINATYITSLAWSPDSQHLILASVGGPVEIIDLLGDAIATLIAQNSAYLLVVWSSDGQYIAVGGDQLPVEIWQVATSQFVYTDQQHGNVVMTFAWSPDSTHMVSAWYDANASDYRIEGWDALTSANTFLYGHDTERPNALVWSPDGSRIACGDNNGTINIWSLGNATPFAIVTDTNAGDASDVYGLAWSPDGSRIVSSDFYGAIQIWDASTGRNIVTYHQP